jgi:PPOX class probable F420-dependent enzyme
MRLDPVAARARLAAGDHGVLATVHALRGADAVPCVFAVDDDDFVGVPVDLVKPKSSTRLRRTENLEADPRASLLVEQWDAEDWSRLWWVRAELLWVPAASPEREASLADLLAARYPQYRDRPFDRVLVLHLVAVTGWAALAENGIAPPLAPGDE